MRLAHIELDTPDPAGLQEFYTGLLGLPLTSTDSVGFTVSAGATRLTFRQSPTAYRYHFAFSLPISQFDSAKAWVQARVPLIVDKSGHDEFDSEDWNARNFYFYDPIGNILELIARRNQSQPDSSTFTPHSLSAICEIGLTTPDVPATVTRLQTELGLGVYDGEGSDTFTAVGNDDGLFIVVKQNRLWYPDTGVPATINPTRVVLDTGAQVHQSDSGLQISPAISL